MLESDMLEKNINMINIKDSDPTTVKMLLDHIYTNKVPDQNQSLESLLYLSVKYDIKSLVAELQERLKFSGSAHVVIRNLVLCFLYFPGSNTFLEVLEVAKKNLKSVMLDKSWEELCEFYPDLRKNLVE